MLILILVHETEINKNIKITKHDTFFFFNIVYYCFVYFFYKTLIVAHFIHFVVKYNVFIE